MGPYLTLPQVGSFIVSHVRYAFRRQSSSHSGSCFLAEIIRTMSSLSPRGTDSCSTSVKKPYLYSRLASCSIVSVDVLMIHSSPRCSMLNDTPQPQVLVACGLLRRKPLLKQARVVVEHGAVQQPEALRIDEHLRAVRPIRKRHRRAEAWPPSRTMYSKPEQPPALTPTRSRARPERVASIL